MININIICDTNAPNSSSDILSSLNSESKVFSHFSKAINCIGNLNNFMNISSSDNVEFETDDLSVSGSQTELVSASEPVSSSLLFVFDDLDEQDDPESSVLIDLFKTVILFSYKTFAVKIFFDKSLFINKLSISDILDISDKFNIFLSSISLPIFKGNL